jgi:hypothetical protein
VGSDTLPLRGGSTVAKRRSGGSQQRARCEAYESTRSSSHHRRSDTPPRSRGASRPSFDRDFIALEKRRAQGRPDAWPAPMARLQNKTQAAVTTGGPNNRPSLRDGFDGLYVVSSGTGSLAPVVSATHRRRRATWPQHREARTARFHRRIGYVRPREQTHAATRRAHRIPHPTSVTIAKRPLIRGGMDVSNHDF